MTLPAGPLVSTGWLAEHLGAPGLVILDASWYLPQQQRDPRAEFRAGHIPGARWFDLDAASDPDTDLPHMLPTPAHAAASFGALGVGNDSAVIVYDGSGTQLSAPRLWWMLRAMGHEAVRVLDGGWQKWCKENRPVQTGGEKPPKPQAFTPRPVPGLVRHRGDVAAAVAADSAQVVDARAAPRFRGEVDEPRPGLRRGHIPGAKNLPFTELVDPVAGTYLPPTELRARVDAAGIDPARPVITSCGSGVTACSLALALELAGHADVSVYDGSWAEWGALGGEQ